MKLKDFRKDAHEFTSKLSDINRNLAFAGIAIIWIFKVEINESISLPNKFLLPLLLVLLSLVIDLIQYLYLSIIWTHFHRSKEREKINDEEEIKAPKSYSNIAYFLFYGKVFFNMAGYISLFIIISKQIFS